MYSLQIEGGGVKSLRIAALDEDLGQYEVVWQLGRVEALGVWQMGQANTGGRSVLVTTEREAGSTGAGHLAMDSFLSFPVQSCDTVPEAAQVTTTTPRCQTPLQQQHQPHLDPHHQQQHQPQQLHRRQTARLCALELMVGL